MAGITTHVLDTAKGRPAAGVAIDLEIETGDGWSVVGSGTTDDDGRLRTLVSDPSSLRPGRYRISFATGEYFGDAGHFFPRVSIEFLVDDAAQHYHVPLLLSPFGFSTYRGS